MMANIFFRLPEILCVYERGLTLNLSQKPSIEILKNMPLYDTSIHLKQSQNAKSFTSIVTINAKFYHPKFTNSFDNAILYEYKTY